VGFWVLLEQKLRFELESWNGLTVLGFRLNVPAPSQLPQGGESASVKKVRGIGKLTLDVGTKVGLLSQQVGSKNVEI